MTEPTSSVEYRLRGVETGLIALEARLDSRFEGISRQVNGVSERLDALSDWNHTHANNHHSRLSGIKQGGLAASAAAVLVAIAAIIEKFFL